MGDCDVERFIFPDGTERDLLVFGQGSAAACSPSPRPEAGEAHVCPVCKSPLVHPTDWRRTAAATWRITLRCPNCETIRTLTLSRAEVERLNKALYEGTEKLARQADQMARRHFQEESEKFVAALDADLILPIDF
jgi:hypothetical protein